MRLVLFDFLRYDYKKIVPYYTEGISHRDECNCVFNQMIFTSYSSKFDKFAYRFSQSSRLRLCRVLCNVVYYHEYYTIQSMLCYVQPKQLWRIRPQHVEHPHHR